MPPDPQTAPWWVTVILIPSAGAIGLGVAWLIRTLVMEFLAYVRADIPRRLEELKTLTELTEAIRTMRDESTRHHEVENRQHEEVMREIRERPR